MPRLQWVFHAYDELLQLWCYAPDLDSFEHAGNEVVTFTTGEVTTDYDMQDYRTLTMPCTD